jgi:enoyl-[acyl-carrier protein] reductase III
MFPEKVAVVTGGSRGIGKAIAEMFAREGAAVVFSYLRSHDTAERTEADLRALGARCKAVRADARDGAKVQDLIRETVEQFGGVDFVVSNAASGVNRPALELNEKAWDWTINTNARTLLYLAQAAVPSMMERGGGRFVSLSSLGANRVVRDYTAVGVSKAALEALTRYLGAELAQHRITVNCVSASVVETDALTHFTGGARLLQEGRERNPSGRMVAPEDVAGVVRFLCSPEAAMIVGQTIVVDGGYSLPV